MRAFPGFEAKIQGSKLIAEGQLRPSAISASYRVRIEYVVGEIPDVRVLDPALVCREGAKRIPHMYGQESLCLYLPAAQQWSGDMPLGYVILPWISLWLLNYEMWHVTGEWLGGGVEPPSERPYRREREQAYERR